MRGVSLVLRGGRKNYNKGGGTGLTGMHSCQTQVEGGASSPLQLSDGGGVGGASTMTKVVTFQAGADLQEEVRVRVRVYAPVCLCDGKE